MLTCLIIDDEPSAVNILKDYVKKTPFLELVATANDPLEVLEIVKNQSIDLIFLDIQMPNLSGMDLMKILPKKTKVIITTAYSDYAVDGFKLEALDYLVKPISFERFLNAAQRGLNNSAAAPSKWQSPEKEGDYFFVKTEMKGKMVKINFADIWYIEGLKNYVSIYTATDRIIAYLSFKELEMKLPKTFMRVHKSYVVALNRIKAVDGNQILLYDLKPAIPLGETYRKAFFANLQSKLIGGKK